MSCEILAYWISAKTPISCIPKYIKGFLGTKGKDIIKASWVHCGENMNILQNFTEIQLKNISRMNISL